MYDPNLIPFVPHAMRALLNDVARGSHFYVTASVPVTSIQSLVNRWHERFELDLTASQRNYRRKKGQAVFRLHMFPEKDSLNIRCYLLRTKGDHPLLKLERWQDAHHSKQRLEWLYFYELVQLPVPVKHRRAQSQNKNKKINPVGWTWRYKREVLEQYRQMIRHSSARQDDRIQQLVYSLRRAPGFSGVRADVAKMYRYIHSQCERHKIQPPELPTTIRWITPTSTHKVPLSTVVRRVQQGRATWFPNAIAGLSNLQVPQQHHSSTKGKNDADKKTQNRKDSPDAGVV